MREWLQSYGYLLAILAAVIVLFVVVFYFAVRAYSKHMKAFKKEEAELKRLTALKEKYRTFDEKIIKNTHNDEILEGVALIYQLHLQKIDDIEGAFLALNEAQQYIYVLDIFVSDAGVKAFFRENTDILRSRIVPALELIGLQAESEKVKIVSRMFDMNDLEASINEKTIDEVDSYLSEIDIISKIRHNSAEYIKENLDKIRL